MSRLWKTVLPALGITIAIAGVTLLLLMRFVSPTPSDAEAIPPYTIREWEGRVAVFEEAQTYPKQVFDSFVSALPPEQQTQLKAGIPVEDDTQLSLLLEDLTS